MLIDFFRGEPSDKIDVEGLRFVVVVTADEPTSSTSTNNDGENPAPLPGMTDPRSIDPSQKPILRLRVYGIRTKRSGTRLPRVEVEEHGPRMDFRLGRMREPDPAMLKEAMKKAKTPQEERTKKNISMDLLGDKIGRIHMGKTDLSKLQTRKMKGLKRGRDEDEGGEDDRTDVVEAGSGEKKKKKKVKGWGGSDVQSN